MSVHVLLDTTFFRTSVPIAPQQRLLSIPAGRGMNEGDTVFLRDESGTLTWVADVLLTGDVAGVEAWSGADEATGRYAILGYLARIHPGVLPAGKSRLMSPWVTLNSRTLENTLPWWNSQVLIYHSTLHLIEGLLTVEEVQEGLRQNCLLQHTSGHIIIPHGEARKRVLAYVKGVELRCSLCGGEIASLEEATQDHVIPISQGGADALANIELTHRSCNEVKGNALPEQYPPMFLPPEQKGAWRPPTFRNGRHVHQRRGRGRPQPSPSQLKGTLPLRGTGSALFTGDTADETVETAEVAKLAPALSEKAAEKPQTDVKGTPATAPAEMSTPSPDVQAKPSAPQRDEAAPQKKVDASKNGTVDVDSVWLERVQQCNWSELIELASERDWAAKTASLRTLEQLPRSDIKQVQSAGKPLASAAGAKGSFQLFEWNGSVILVEQRSNRRHYFVVKSLRAISWDTYVWYLTRYGRTTPLATAMALMPLWRQGKPDSEGRIRVQKSGMQIMLEVEDDQLVVTEYEEDSTGVA